MNLEENELYLKVKNMEVKDPTAKLFQTLGLEIGRILADLETIDKRLTIIEAALRLRSGQNS